jgi:hypothetical protein
LWRRQGVFSSLTRVALGRLQDLGISVLFNTPNEQSLPGYLKMGWAPIGRAVREVLVGGPRAIGLAALARLHRNGTGAEDAGAAPDTTLRDLAYGLRPRGRGTQVVKDAAYLRWRYGRHPWFRYQVVRSGGADAVVRLTALRGIRTATLVESTARDGSQWRRVLEAVASQTASPLAQLLHTHSWGDLAQVDGWLRITRPGPVVVARSDAEIDRDSAWALTTGELEFF